MFCKQCGNELKEGAVFCQKCGTRQTASAAPIQNIADDMEKTIGVFGAMPGAQSEPSVGGTVSQPRPAVETPVQPVYQAPVQPQNTYTNGGAAAQVDSVGFSEAITLMFKNYANFSGRASKSEYWWGFLFNFLASFILGFIPVVGAVIALGLLVPGLSLGVRRLHDIGKEWYVLFMGLIPIAGSIILIIYFCRDSEGDNQWGPGPANATYGSTQFVNTPANNAAPVQRVITDNDIYVMAQNHEPINFNTPDANRMMTAALARIVPTYTGMENLAGALMLCDPQLIKANIEATDTDTLLVVFKALGFYIGQGGDAKVLGIVQQNVLTTLKTRF